MAKKRRKPRNNRNKLSATSARAKTSKKSTEKLKVGKALEGIATLTESFAIGIGAIGQANAIRAKGKFEEAELIANAEELGLGAEDILDRGRIAASQTLEGSRQTQGTQRAQLAGSGVDISTGSASDVLAETVQLGIEDRRIIRTNAFRQAFGLKRQAINLRAQARQSRVGRKFRERTTLISGGLQAISSITSGIGSLADAGAFDRSGRDVSASNLNRRANDRVVT